MVLSSRCGPSHGTKDLPAAGVRCRGCVCYLLGRLPPVRARDVGDEAGAEDGDADQHAEPQACRRHAASAGHRGCTRPSQDGTSGRRAKKGDVTEVSRAMGTGWRWVRGCLADLAAVAFSQ